MNKCEHVNCIANQGGTCTYYREPVWEEFASPDCARNTNEMFEVESEINEMPEVPQ